MKPSFGYGDAVEVKRSGCLFWLRGVVIGGRHDPHQMFLITFDHGEQSWHHADTMRHCVRAPVAELPETD